MARKKQKAPEGAPEWMVTYGDMMTLLLCFFVILFSLSELKKEEQVREILESLNKAFGGYKTSMGPTPGPEPPKNTLLQILRRIRPRIDPKKRGHAVVEGQTGRYTEVRRVNEGAEFQIGRGGRSPFARGEDRILPEFEPELRRLADALRGCNNVLSVRGHCSLDDFAPGSAREKYDELSYARARAIKEFLVGRCGIRPKRIRAVACGANQPLNARAYTAEEHADNRRVEIIFRQVLVDDFGPAEPVAEAEGSAT
jgi:chemotaxis protein MotB